MMNDVLGLFHIRPLPIWNHIFNMSLLLRVYPITLAFVKVYKGNLDKAYLLSFILLFFKKIWQNPIISAFWQV